MASPISSKFKPAKGKRWAEKLDKPAKPEVVQLEGKSAEKWGRGTMVISTPRTIIKYLKLIPEGSFITVNELRGRLAADAGATIACPLTTGIFLRIVAEASEEAVREGQPQLAPWWRVVKEGNKLNEKMPGGQQRHAQLLEEEGHSAVPKGKHLVVVG